MSLASQVETMCSRTGAPPFNTPTLHRSTLLFLQRDVMFLTVECSLINGCGQGYELVKNI